MTRTLSLIDRLRIERAVWKLSLLTQDLPAARRTAVRRDLRANLRAASADTGGRQAVHGLGSLRRLAIDYLDAEYGEDQPRPRWLTGLAWTAAIEVIFLAWLVSGFIGFIDGILAVDRPGTYLWRPLGSWGPHGQVTVRPDGFATEVFFSLWALILFLVVFVIAGRIWRLLPQWRRHRQTRHEPA